MPCDCYPANETCPGHAACWNDGHVTLASGMVRSDDDGKPDYTLLDLGMLERWAWHMTRNVRSKGRDNWRRAHTEEDLRRFRASLARHVVAYLRGDDDEDHAAAIFFNIAGAEHVARKLL
jgi:hypothetical protein